MEPVTLEFPLTIAGKTVDRISLRRPKVKDMLAAQAKQNQAEQEITLIAALAEPTLTTEQVLALDFGDFQKLRQALAKLAGNPVAVAQTAAAATTK